MTTSTTPRSLKGKTLFITGASRGIGLAIAKRAAADGAEFLRSEGGHRGANLRSLDQPI